MGTREDRLALYRGSGQRPEAAGPLKKKKKKNPLHPGERRISEHPRPEQRAPQAAAAFTCTLRSCCSPGVLWSLLELKSGWKTVKQARGSGQPEVGTPEVPGSAAAYI